MARLNWDRLRRVRPLDGADVRVDTDGARLWERTGEGGGEGRHGVGVPFGSRRLRRGVIVRRRQERAGAEAGANASASANGRANANASFDANARADESARANANAVDATGGARPPLRAGPIRCQRCGARVSPGKLLRHARRCPRRTET